MVNNVLTPPERLLLGPGPSNPHPAVRAAMAAPLVGHLDPWFIGVMEETMDGLRRLYRTANHHTVPISGTGTAGLETLVFNLLEPGDRAIVGVIGYFGQRLAELARRAGAVVETIEIPLGGIVEPEQVAAALRRPAKLVALVHAETSTGAHQPVEAIARIAREHDALLLLDCVTSLAGLPVEMDAWGVDAAGSCSQKCIGAPPGLGPITLGPRAIAAMQRRKTKPFTWYFDVELLFEYWGGEGQKGQKGQKGQARVFHHTAPVANLYGFREALRLIHEEGLEARWARHRAAHQRLVEGLDRLGLELFTPASYRLPMLNVIRIPEHVEDAAARSRLLEMGIEIGAGFGPLKGKAWRVGLMGVNAAPEPVDRLLGALEEVLSPTG